MKLSCSFYNQPTLKVAQNLLGCFLIRKIGLESEISESRLLVGRIVETEAYIGPNDLASHASRGKTPRNEIMFGPPGYAYVYLVYGMYYMFNIVTEHEGYPAAVLIRAVEPCSEGEICKSRLQTLTNGPGKLCKWLKIDKQLNGVDLCGNEIWVESIPIDMRVDMRIGMRINANYDSNFEIKKSTRIGVDYAGKWKNKLWRFYIKGNKWVSKK